MSEPLLDPGDLDWILPVVRETVVAFFPTNCTWQRLDPDGLPGDRADLGALPCRVVPDGRQLYPMPAIPNQPVQSWQVHLPAGTDCRANDLLTLADGRVYVVVHTTEPGAYDTRRVALCVLSALPEQPLGSAYLRANATVASIRDRQPLYDARRVHLAYGQANPAAPLERLTGGVATLQISLFALADDDFKQGDAVTVLAQDGPTVLPGIVTFTLAGVVRRPLPYTILEADCIADVLGR